MKKLKVLLVIVVALVCLGIVTSGSRLTDYVTDYVEDLHKDVDLTIGGAVNSEPIAASEYLMDYRLQSSTDFYLINEEAWQLWPKTMHTMDTSSGYLKVTCIGYDNGGDAMFYSSTNNEGYGSDVAFSFDLKRTETQPLISRVNIKVANDAGTMKDVSIIGINADGSVSLSSVDANGTAMDVPVTTLSNTAYRRITCGIDLEGMTADVFVDGKQIVEGALISVPDGYDKVVRLFYLYVSPTWDNYDNYAQLILDNVKVYASKDFINP